MKLAIILILAGIASIVTAVLVWIADDEEFPAVTIDQERWRNGPHQ